MVFGVLFKVLKNIVYLFWFDVFYCEQNRGCITDLKKKNSFKLLFFSFLRRWCAAFCKVYNFRKKVEEQQVEISNCS